MSFTRSDKFKWVNGLGYVYPESKKAAEARLSAADLWGEFQKRVDFFISGGESKRVAWYGALLEFPPAGVDVVRDWLGIDEFRKGYERRNDFTGVEDLHEFKGRIEESKKRGDLKKWGTVLRSGEELQRSVFWIYDHIGDESVTAEDAPCAGDYAYLVALRDSPALLGSFYRDVYSKMLPSGTALNERRKFMKGMKTVDQLLHRLEGVAEALDGVDKDIGKEV